jgi:hypothetical protein
MNLSNFKRLRIFDAIKDKFIIREDLKYTLTQALLLSARMKTATSRQDWEHVSYLCSFAIGKKTGMTHHVVVGSQTNIVVIDTT